MSSYKNNDLPLSFKIRFWFSYSAMGGGTGFVLGYLFGGPYGSLIGLVTGIVLSQIGILDHFGGSRRGKFEYLYQKFTRKKQIKKTLIKILGRITYFKTQLSEFGEITWSKGEKYQELLNQKNSYLPEVLFCLYLKIGFISQRKRAYEKAVLNLKCAIEMFPTDIVANFVLAECHERLGFGEEAISAYEDALKDRSCKSEKLNRFINDQINRVRKNGPSKKPPIPGLMHSGLGR